MRMSHKLLVRPLLFLLIFTGIASVRCDCSRFRNSDATNGKAIYIVFIDMSKSLDSSAFTKALDKLESIYKNCPQTVQTLIRVYPIHMNSARLTSPLYDLKADKNIYSTNTDEIEKHKRRRESIWSKASDSLLSLYTNLSTQGDLLNQTCILEALYNTQLDFDTLEHKESSKKLIIISDMIEDCNSTDIHMNKNEEDLDYANSKASKVVEGITLPDNLEIIIYVPSSPGGNTKLKSWITTVSLKRFWEQLFDGIRGDSSPISFKIL